MHLTCVIYYSWTCLQSSTPAENVRAQHWSQTTKESKDSRPQVSQRSWTSYTVDISSQSESKFRFPATWKKHLNLLNIAEVPLSLLGRLCIYFPSTLMAKSHLSLLNAASGIKPQSVLKYNLVQQHWWKNTCMPSRNHTLHQRFALLLCHRCFWNLSLCLCWQMLQCCLYTVVPPVWRRRDNLS